MIEFECARFEPEELDVPFPAPLSPWEPSGEGPREELELEPREDELYCLEGAREFEPEPIGDRWLKRSGIE